MADPPASPVHCKPSQDIEPPKTRDDVERPQADPNAIPTKQPNATTSAKQPSTNITERPTTNLAEQPSTATPAEQPSTTTSAEQPSTTTPAEQPSTTTPAEQPSTTAPAEQPSANPIEEPDAAGAVPESIPARPKAKGDEPEVNNDKPKAEDKGKVEGNEPEATYKKLEAEDDELEEARKELKAKDNELEEARKKLKAKDDELEEARKELGAKNNGLGEARKELEAKDGELEEARKGLKAKDDVLGEARKELGAKGGELEEARQKLKAKDDELEEARKELGAKGGELEEARQGLKAKDDELEEARKELKTKDNDLEESRKELKTKDDDLEESRKELKTKDDDLKEARKELEATRDHVFRLQPRRADLTEDEAIASFTGLRQAVVYLVRNRLKPALEALNSGRLLSCRPVPDQAEAFKDLIKDAAKNSLRVAGADEYHVIAVVMEFLHKEIFAKPFSFVSKKEMDVLEDAFRLLVELRKNNSYCEDWKKEAFAAFASNPGRENTQEHIKKVAKKLCFILSAVFDLPNSTQPTKKTTRAEARKSLLDSVHDDIVAPAVKLASTLGLATSVYTVQWPTGNPTQELGPHHCFSLATDTTPSADNEAAPTNTAAGGALHRIPSLPVPCEQGYLFEVAPALIVRSVYWPGGHRPAEARTLCAATVLVQGDGKVDWGRYGTIMDWLDTARSSHSIRGRTHVAASKLQRITYGVGGDNRSGTKIPGRPPKSDDSLGSELGHSATSYPLDDSVETRTGNISRNPTE
ncbi:hypothetical protein RB594_007736 [Gaeumannomyces avenae]